MWSASDMTEVTSYPYSLPAFVGKLPKYPGVFFVRCGTWIVARTEDGWMLEYYMGDDR